MEQLYSAITAHIKIMSVLNILIEMEYNVAKEFQFSI